MKNKLFMGFTLVLMAFFLLPLVAEGATPTANEIAGIWSGEATLVQSSVEGDLEASNVIPLTLDLRDDGSGTAEVGGLSYPAFYRDGMLSADLSIGMMVENLFSATARREGDWVIIEGTINSTYDDARSTGTSVYAWSARKKISLPAEEEYIPTLTDPNFPADEDFSDWETGDGDIPTLTDPEQGGADWEDVEDFDPDSLPYDWNMGLVPDGWDWVPCDCEDGPWEKHAGPLGATIISIIAAIAAALGGAGGSAGGALAGAIAEALGLAGEAAGMPGEGPRSGDYDYRERESTYGPPADSAYSPPETMELVVNHKGTPVEYVRDPETGDWVNPLTGGVFDPEAYEKIVKPAMEANREFDQEAWQRNVDGTTGFDWRVYEGEIDRYTKLDKLESQLKLERLELKYGVKGEQAVKKSIEQAMAEERAWSEKWRKIGNNLETLERGAEFADDLIDAGLYGAAYVVPGGKVVYMGYKGVKGVAVTVAEKGVSVKTVSSGVLRGASDAARVYVSSPYAKAALSFAGETAAGAVEDGWKGLGEGAAKGAVKTVVLGVTDKVAKISGAPVIVKGVSNRLDRIFIKPSLKKVLN